MAWSIDVQSAGGTMAMVGNGRTEAPYAVSRSANSEACSCGRVTSTVVPNKGLFSNQFSLALRFTTSPTTITVGGSRAAVSDFFTISASVLTMVFCSALVPHRIKATGVVAERTHEVRWDPMARRYLRPN